jgi:hypothetical protein
MPIRSKLRTVLAQKDQLLEICPVVRLGKPIICEGLSVPCDKPRPSAHVPAAQVLRLCVGIMLGPWSPNNSSLYDVKQNRRKAKSLPQTLFLRMNPTTRSPVWWSRTGSNRRPPACKAGALPAELRPLIPGKEWWAWEDLNLRPHAYQARALTN